MIPFRNINNGAMRFTKAMPHKESTSSNNNDFSVSRNEYAKTVEATKGKKWFGSSNNRDASQIIANRKKNSVGIGSLNANKEEMSFLKSDNSNDIDVLNAKQRMRSRGYGVPPKARGIIEYYPVVII